MYLFCYESAGDENNAYDDPTLLQDSRVLVNLLRTEDRYLVSPIGTFYDIQTEVTEEMRKIVAEWMMEVCEEQECSDPVYSLAMTCMDRILGCCFIKKNQLQLLGTACMLIASKIRESRPLSAETLVFYTDNSVTKQQLTRFELLVLSKLKWDVAAVTPQDFLKHLLNKLDVQSVGISYELVQKHAKTLITLCSREFRFTRYNPSIIACASITSALCGLNWVSKSGCSREDLLEKLAEITHIEKDYLDQCLEQIDNMIRESTLGYNYSMDMQYKNDSRTEEFTTPPLKTEEHEAALTPTDVHDVHI